MAGEKTDIKTTMCPTKLYPNNSLNEIKTNQKTEDLNSNKKYLEPKIDQPEKEGKIIP
jgi:hypothetical protein